MKKKAPCHYCSVEAVTKCEVRVTVDGKLKACARAVCSRHGKDLEGVLHCYGHALEGR